MISYKDSICPCCKGELKYYDKVQRIIRGKGGYSKWVYIRRFKCLKCGLFHRELPIFIQPYKHYETDIIFGVLDGFIFHDTIGYEDYPCEQTMMRWLRTLNLQLL